MLIKRKKFIMTTDIKKLPNGNSVQLDFIIHPGATLILPLLSSDKVIMLRQWRAVLNKYLLELPAGTIDKGESILKCAKRELIEETGYAAGKVTKLGQIYPVPGYSTEMIYIYKAEKLKPFDGHKEPDEVLQAKVFSKTEVRKMFKAGQILDGKSICALAMAGWI